jgi:tRNA U34 5-methylaminomethyl-2-thiouridine-forming methyltransferase MnmC
MEDELQLVITGDGSPSIFSSRFGQHYHSTFGAVTESMTVFIRNGLHYFLSISKLSFSPEKPLRIFEMGFGTGLNTFLTFSETRKLNIPAHYTAIEAYPLPDSLLEMLLNSGVDPDRPQKTNEHGFRISTTEGVNRIGENFTLELQMINLEQWNAGGAVFNIIFFDAFSPDVQPELWSEAIFQQMYHNLAPGGILVTYCVKGVVVRALKAAGFAVEKLPGPPGKRHVLRALKNN